VFARLFLLFTLVPLVELFLLIEIGRRIGAMPTIALVLLTGALGALLAKREGARTLGRFRSDLASGRMPEDPLMNGVAILIGGAVLITPGILTDILGFALLVPTTRRALIGRARRALARRASARRGEIEARYWSSGPPPDDLR
jgi:UPF0716 protein FxsA